MLGAVAVLAATTGGTDERDSMVIIDFSRSETIWPHINDGVMGGVSSGRMVPGDGYATFQGVVSFDNNGGFSSVRSRPVLHDLSEYSGLRVRVRGDGKRYGFRLKTDASFDGVSYQVSIVPPADEWVELELPFDDFVPVYRGRVVSNHPQLDPARIMTFGLIISRQEGPFRLDVESIAATTAANETGADS
ncbi:MAG: CIA30 family protein [Candidatus Sulfomarinibacteraceae bacterium]